jgi:cholestenol Delta-isomerase
MLSFIPLVVLNVLAVIFALFSKREKVVIYWLLFSGVVHILLEGSYLRHHEEIRIRATSTFSEKMMEDVHWEKALQTQWWGSLYSQYAKYDGRYAVSDPLVVFFCWTELVEGVFCFVLAYFIQTNSPYRHPFQLLISTAQFYGTILYFLGPVIYNNWNTVMTSDPFDLYVYVVFLNGLWMLVPGLLIIQSFKAIANTLGQKRGPPSKKNN